MVNAEIVQTRFYLTLLLALGLVIPAGQAHSETPGPEGVRYELLRLLIAEGNHSLTNRKFCEKFVQGGQDTVGKFIAWNLSFYSDKQANSLVAACDGKPGTKLCTITFYADSKGESPWACGLRFKYDSKKSKVDTSTIECIGTC